MKLNISCICEISMNLYFTGHRFYQMFIKNTKKLEKFAHPWFMITFQTFPRSSMPVLTLVDAESLFWCVYTEICLFVNQALARF